MLKWAGPCAQPIFQRLDNPPVTNLAYLHEQANGALVDLVSVAFAHYQTAPMFRTRQRLGPFVMDVLANDRALGERLTHCLLPSDDLTAISALDLLILSGGASPFADPPEWNFPHSDQRHLERLHISADSRISAFYDHDRRFWWVHDRVAKQAIFWVAADGEVPFWEDAAPFKMMLHWALAGSDLAMVHGAIVANPDCGALLVGPGGSGKSTTTAACFAAGMAVGGDDLVLIDKSSGAWHGHALYDALKLSPNSAVPVPQMLIAAPSRLCGEKSLVRYSDARADGLALTRPLRASFQCVVGTAPETVIEPLHPAVLLRALAPPTVFLLRGHEAHSLRLIGMLVRDLPCYRLRLGPDPAAAAAVLAEFLDNGLPS